MKKWQKLGMSIGLALLLGQEVAPVSYFSAQETTAWNQTNMSQMDQFVFSWASTMGQHYSRFYPNAVSDADKQQLKQMVAGLQLDGADFDYGLADEKPNAEYLIEYVYSTFGKDERVITYYFVNHKGTAMVLVNDSSSARAVNQVWQTQNQELSGGFRDFVAKADWQATPTVRGKVEWTKEKLQELDQFMVQWKGNHGTPYHQVYPDTSVPHHEYIANHFFDIHRTLLEGKWYNISYSTTNDLMNDITIVAAYSNYFEGINLFHDHFLTLFFGYLSDKTPVVLQISSTNGDIEMRRTNYTEVSDKFIALANQPVSEEGTQAITTTDTTTAQIVAEIQANPIETVKKLFPLRDKQFSEAEGQEYMKKTLWATPLDPGIKRYPSFRKLKDGFYEGGESTGGPAIAVNFFKVSDVIIEVGKYDTIIVYDLKQGQKVYQYSPESLNSNELLNYLSNQP